MTSCRPSLTLLIPVYRGGGYWQECWESVRPLAHRFDRILISFNYSEMQTQDFAVIADDLPENAVYILQPCYLSSLQHFLAFIDRLQTDYVFFLCHDDWLLEEGLDEVQALLQKQAGQNIAIFGAHAWVETESTYPGVTREVAAFRDGISVADFVMYDIDRPFLFSASGLVTPVKELQRYTPLARMFGHGFRFDNFLITHPGVGRIFQTVEPSVRIRLHEGQQGRQSDDTNRVADCLTYYFIQALYASDALLVRRAVQQQLWLLLSFPSRTRRLHTLKRLARLFLASLAWEGGKNHALFLVLFLPGLGRWALRSLPHWVYARVRKELGSVVRLSSR